MEVRMDENNRTTDQEDAETGESRGRFSRAKEYVGGKYNTMRERAEAAGGRLSVETSLGNGTTVRTTVPL